MKTPLILHVILLSSSVKTWCVHILYNQRLRILLHIGGSLHFISASLFHRAQQQPQRHTTTTVVHIPDFSCTLRGPGADVGTPGIRAPHPHQDPQLSSPLAALGGQESASHSCGSRHPEVDQCYSSRPHRWAAGFRGRTMGRQSRRVNVSTKVEGVTLLVGHGATRGNNAWVYKNPNPLRVGS